MPWLIVSLAAIVLYMQGKRVLVWWPTEGPPGNQDAPWALVQKPTHEKLCRMLTQPTSGHGNSQEPGLAYSLFTHRWEKYQLLAR